MAAAAAAANSSYGGCFVGGENIKIFYGVIRNCTAAAQEPEKGGG